MSSLRFVVLLIASAATSALQAADAFAPVGARATLSVEYRFEASGREQAKTDLHEWRVKRNADMVAELEARKPQPMSVMQPPEPGQMAKVQQQQAQAQKAAAQMAPMMADAQAVAAKCGGDEKCIEREVMKMGAGMAGTKQLDETLKTGKETAAVMQPGADRYQHFESRTQKGSYTIDESWHVVHADPICMSLPKARCTHDMVRKGSGEVAATRSAAQVEIDVQAKTMTLRLPVPHGVLGYLETHTTDEPQGTHDTSTPKGPVNGQMPLRVSSDNKSVPTLVTAALKGDWRSQTGEQVIALGAGAWHGAPGEPGKLIVRWRFSAQ